MSRYWNGSEPRLLASVPNLRTPAREPVHPVPRTMKILFTMTGAWGTGSGTVVDALSRVLVQRGHRIAVLYPQAPVDAEIDSGAGEGVFAPGAQHEVWTFPVENGTATLPTFPLMISDPNPANLTDAPTFRELTDAQLALYIDAFRARLAAVVADFQPDVIECQHVWAMPHVAAELGLPYIAVAHHSDQMGFRQDRRMQPIAIHAAQKAAYVFAISDAVRDDVVALYDVPPARVPVIYNGYDHDLFQPRPVDRAALFEAHELPIPADAPVVTFAGKLSRTKGIDILLEANRRIQEARPVHFVIFGTGTLEDALDPEAADRYDDTNVHFLGHRDYAVIAAFHNAADLSVMPSRTEGFGIAGLEAMGCGLPLVVTRTGGLDRFSKGAVVPPGDPAALADAVLRIVDLPEAAYRKLSADALEAARAFSWESVMDERLEYYADVAGG